MFDPSKLPSIDAQAQAMRRGLRDSVRSYWRSQVRSLEAALRRIEENRQAVPLLQAAGLDVRQHPYHDNALEMVVVDLGGSYSSRREARRVEEAKRLIVHTLGCHLEEYVKDVEDGPRRLVRVTLRPAKFLGVHVRYIARLPRAGAKCKIVRRREKASSDYSLECLV